MATSAKSKRAAKARRERNERRRVRRQTVMEALEIAKRDNAVLSKALWDAAALTKEDRTVVTWTDSSGKVWALDEMSDSYLLNTMDYLRENYVRIAPTTKRKLAAMYREYARRVERLRGNLSEKARKELAGKYLRRYPKVAIPKEMAEAMAKESMESTRQIENFAYQIKSTIMDVTNREFPGAFFPARMRDAVDKKQESIERAIGRGVLEEARRGVPLRITTKTTTIEFQLPQQRKRKLSFKKE